MIFIYIHLKNSDNNWKNSEINAEKYQKHCRYIRNIFIFCISSNFCALFVHIFLNIYVLLLAIVFYKSFLKVCDILC